MDIFLGNTGILQAVKDTVVDLCKQADITKNPVLTEACNRLSKGILTDLGQELRRICKEIGASGEIRNISACSQFAQAISSNAEISQWRPNMLEFLGIVAVAITVFFAGVKYLEYQDQQNR